MEGRWLGFWRGGSNKGRLWWLGGCSNKKGGVVCGQVRGKRIEREREREMRGGTVGMVANEGWLFGVSISGG